MQTSLRRIAEKAVLRKEHRFQNLMREFTPQGGIVSPILANIYLHYALEEHSTDEERYISIGISANSRLIMLAHTDREERIRIISARKATKKEERFYADSE